MKFNNRVREKLSINSINPMVVDKERRELKTIVVDILKTVTGVRLYGYKMLPVNLEEDFRMTNVDYMHKTKAKEDIYIDMSDDVISCMECWFVLNEDKVSENTIEYGKANTRRELVSLPKLEWYDEHLRQEILTYDLGTLSASQEDDTGEPQSLFIRVNLYIPRLINNVIRLNGNHYFNKFHIQDSISLTKEGKLKCQHPTYVSYLNIEKSPNTGLPIFTTNIFSANYNTLLFLGRNPELTKKDIEKILDIEDEDRKTEFAEILDNTINDLDYWDLEDDDVENVRESIPPTDVVDSIYRYIIATVYGGTEEVISLHTSLRGKLRTEIKRGLKIIGKKAKRQNLNTYKSRVNVDPRTICTIIKNNNQYAITKSANEVDTYNFFGYISNIEDEAEITRDRSFRMDQLGIIDPIGTSTSDNVGLAGLLAFSIPDVHLSHKEGN